MGGYYEGAFSVPPYSVYNASLSYDLGASPFKLKGVRLAMNVQNLTNKTYVSQFTGDLDCHHCEGGTMVPSLTYDW
jgi:iron complex outermembrane receptor protein